MLCLALVKVEAALVRYEHPSFSMDRWRITSKHGFDPWISSSDPEAILPRAFKNCPPGVISSLVLPLISFLLSFSHSVVQAERAWTQPSVTP